jgi:ribosomal protein L37AE/L43A
MIASTADLYPSGYSQYYWHETLGPKCPECGSFDTRQTSAEMDAWVCKRCGAEWQETIPF